MGDELLERSIAMVRLRARIVRSARTLALAFLVLSPTLAHAQSFGYGNYVFNYPGFGYGFPGYGYSYGYGVPSLGYGYGFGFPV
jgi:hypothetical protein